MEQLKRLREERGLSQVKLAARADLNPATVNQIERGARNASPGTLRKLASALDVSLVALLEERGSGKAQSPLSEAEQRAVRQHDGLVGVHEATARLGRTVAASFANFGKADLERLAIFHDLCAGLAKMRGRRDVWGREPEDIAEAIDKLEVAEELVQTALQEHLDLFPQETRSTLDELLRERAASG
jgi:transcriptional regulator with XRE-family HTH domain